MFDEDGFSLSLMAEEINFYRLRSGEYRVVKSFTDFYGNDFAAGETLHFLEQHFLPYDGGHTLCFRERNVYLQEYEQEKIIANFNDYFAVAADDQ